MRIIKKINPFLFLFFGLTISLLEIFAYKKGSIFSIIASRLWLIWGVFYLLSSFYLIFRIFLQDIKQKSFLSFLIIPVLVFFCFSEIGNYSILSLESTQQGAIGLKNFQQEDFNYTKSGFLGYPSRQYLIAAIPSFFLGRNLISLRLGFLFPFCLGIFLFYTGLRFVTKGKINGAQIAFFATLSIFTFPYVLEFLLHYEEVIYPLSFTLQAVTWLLFFISKPNFFRAFNLAWIGPMFATSYTPSLGSCALLLLLVFLLIGQNFFRRNWKKAIVLSTVFLVITVFGLCSFSTRQDISLKRERQKMRQEQILKDIIDGYKIFFFSEGKSFLGSLLALPVILYLVSSLFYLNGPLHFLINSWALSVIAASVYLKGYAAPPPSLAMHRAMIIIPPLIAGMALLVTDFFERHKVIIRKKWVMLTTILLIAFSSYNFLQIKKNQLVTTVGYLIKDMLKQSRLLKISQEELINIGIFSQKNDFVSIRDALVYFYPQHRLFRKAEDLPEQFDFSQPGFFYFEPGNPFVNQWLSYLRKNSHLSEELALQSSKEPRVLGVEIGINSSVSIFPISIGQFKLLGTVYLPGSE